MNRSLSFLFTSLLLCQTSVNAQSLKDFFSSGTGPSLYLGIDYTKCKVIDDNSATSTDIRDKYYPGINDLILTESKKYDPKAAFHQSNMDHDLGFVMKKNEKINTDDIKSTSSADYHRLKADDINAVVAGYDFGDKKGIGVLFVMEAMSKSDKGAAMWVTLIDMQGKKVLMTERLEGKTSMGFGFRNYWAIPVHSVLEEIEKKKFKEWKAKYGG
ncbi:MAG TPA: hypothetical protein VMI35_09060 [Puia sp.]|nr:hypothetical protein [Puia sp.]